MMWLRVSKYIRLNTCYYFKSRIPQSLRLFSVKTRACSLANHAARPKKHETVVHDC